MKYPMPGIAGGSTGAPNELMLRCGGADEQRGRRPPPSTCRTSPASGTSTTTAAAAAGATRSTATRKPVLDDVLDEYVSVEGARRDYGVVLTGSLEELTSPSTTSTARCAPTSPRREARRRRVAESSGSRRDLALTLMSSYRIGIDVGGTFTDLVLARRTARSRSTRARPRPTTSRAGVMNGIARSPRATGSRSTTCSGARALIVHGTTTADNTMIEMNGAVTGLITTAGPPRRDRAAPRVQGGHLGPGPPAAAADRPPPRAHRRPRAPRLRGQRRDAARRGRGARRPARGWRMLGVESLAVVFLFSFVNPAPRAAGARDRPRGVAPDVHVSLSHEVMPSAPEFERTTTTLVNAYVGPKIARYLTRPRRPPARGRLPARAAGHAVDRRGHDAGLRRAAPGDGAELGPDRRGHRRVRRRRGGRDGGLRLRRHGRHQLRRLPRPRRRSRRSRPTGTGATATASACRWSTCSRSAPAAARSPRVVAGRAAGRPASAGAAARPGLLRPRRHARRRSPTRTSCSAT